MCLLKHQLLQYYMSEQHIYSIQMWYPENIYINIRAQQLNNISGLSIVLLLILERTLWKYIENTRLEKNCILFLTLESLIQNYLWFFSLKKFPNCIGLKFWPLFFFSDFSDNSHALIPQTLFLKTSLHFFRYVWTRRHHKNYLFHTKLWCNKDVHRP